MTIKTKIQLSDTLQLAAGSFIKREKRYYAITSESVFGRGKIAGIENCCCKAHRALRKADSARTEQI